MRPLLLLALLGCQPAPPNADSAVNVSADSHQVAVAGQVAAASHAGLTIQRGSAPPWHIETIALGRSTLHPLGPATLTAGPCEPDCFAILTRPNLEERWQVDGQSLSQSWTVEAPPAGDGPLVLAVGLPGATDIAGSDQRLTLRDPAGLSMAISRFAAWDAAGHPLPIAATPTADGYRITVEDAGAAYPIEIDPLYTTATWTELGGDGGFGYNAIDAGDLNGDGYDDIAVASYGRAASTGRVQVYYGGGSGYGATPDVVIDGVSLSDQVGYRMAGGGDLNGDGYSDILISSIPTSSTTTARVRVYYGSASGLSTTAATTLSSGGTYDYFGMSVAILGDVNNDGYDDAMVGAYRGTSQKGNAYLYLGSAIGLSTTAARTYTGTAASENLGSQVTRAGDVNGDGYDDALITSGSTDTVRLYLGSASGLASSATTSFTQSSSLYFGNEVAGGADVNGDGYDDIIISDYYTGTGKVYFYPGSASGPSSTATATWVGGMTSSYFGTSLSMGDFNDDGYDDIAVGSPGYSASAGEVGIYYGSATGAAATRSQTLSGSTSDYLGQIVVAGLDANGDGVDDLVLTSPGEGTSPEGTFSTYAGALGTGLSYLNKRSNPDPYLSNTRLAALGDVDHDGYDDFGVSSTNTSSGQYGYLHIYEGSASGPDRYPDLSLQSGSTSLEGFAYSVARLGDVNGDSYDDIAVSAPYTSSSKGSVYIYHGGSPHLSTTAATTLTVTTSATYFGHRVLGLGDVNGDGYNDLCVGNNSSSAEKAIVYYGSAAGITTTGATTLAHGTSYVSFSEAMAAGDINGDGYADVAVGAPDYISSTGNVKVFLGAAAGMSTTATLTLTGESTSSYFGRLLAMGDLNGDGDADLVVGAPGYDSSTGRLYVYYSAGSTGLSSTPATVITGSLSAVSGFVSLAVIGDLSGDGYDDLIVGVSSYSSSAGKAVIYEGSASGLSTSPSTTITAIGPYTPYTIGSIVAGAGDINGDDLDDVLVSGTYHIGLYYGYDTDTDGDGSADSADCAPADASIHPGATEACDGVDNDCDGTTDEGAPVWHPDADGDGYGDSSASVSACTAPTGYVSDSLDCDDSTTAVSPVAAEVCDGLDNDCDGSADEAGATGLRTFYRDTDGDGYGVPGSTISSCTAPSGYSALSTDCDDSDSAEHPGASEVCDGDDDDCDGTTDEASAIDASTWHRDADADGYGAASLSTAACSAPTGYVADATDCDDAAATTHPSAAETCNGVDDDCDGTTDPTTATDATTWYTDGDGDGHGDPALSTPACTAPTGAVATGDDCNDASVLIFPGQDERCNSLDDDCDGSIDEASAIDAPTWYLDSDGDGYGSALGTTTACALPAGYAANATDCDDSDAAHSPASSERCNSADDDCDGLVDEGTPTDASTWYVDADSDGHGDPAASSRACLAPAGAVAAGDDCDDTDGGVSPAAAESCDGRDEDCDGAIDDGLSTTTVYDDADGDTYGDPASVHETCALSTGEVEEAGDCDDGDGDINPAAAEQWYDGVDQDCAGGDDWDADGDGQQVSTHGGGDCDDSDPLVYTGAEDAPYDGKNSDCGPYDDFDADHDGHTAADYGGDDCDDTDPDVVDCPENTDGTDGTDGGVNDGTDGTDGTDGAVTDNSGGGGKSGGCAVSPPPASLALASLIGLVALGRRRAPVERARG